MLSASTESGKKDRKTMQTQNLLVNEYFGVKDKRKTNLLTFGSGFWFWCDKPGFSVAPIGHWDHPIQKKYGGAITHNTDF